MSIGDDLAAARRRAGLTLTQVSKRTCIRETIIGAIERDDYRLCGGDFYTRGHIRAIAHAVGADPGPLIAEYDAAHRPPHPVTAADLPGPGKPIRIRARHRPNWRAGLGIALVAVAGLVAYHLFPAAHPAPAPRPAAGTGLHRAGQHHARRRRLLPGGQRRRPLRDGPARLGRRGVGPGRNAPARRRRAGPE